MKREVSEGDCQRRQLAHEAALQLAQLDELRVADVPDELFERAAKVEKVLLSLLLPHALQERVAALPALSRNSFISPQREQTYS